jgi:phosphatidate cytidylyltransferase
VLAAIPCEEVLRDGSHLIPGQGGFLNQPDRAIFAAPMMYRPSRLWLAD